MIGTFKINQAETFNSVNLMGVEPKTEFRSDDQQCTKDGTPKWTAKVVVTYSVFGKTEYETLNVNIAAPQAPGQDLQPFAAIEIEGFEVNVGPKTNRDRQQVPGIQQWYRADSLKLATSTSATAGKSTKTEAAA